MEGGLFWEERHAGYPRVLSIIDILDINIRIVRRSSVSDILQIMTEQAARDRGVRAVSSVCTVVRALPNSETGITLLCNPPLCSGFLSLLSLFLLDVQQ